MAAIGHRERAGGGTPARSRRVWLSLAASRVLEGRRTVSSLRADRRRAAEIIPHRRAALQALTAKRSLPDYKPVSVPLRATVIRLGRALLPGSSDLPESRTERAAPPLLFGLAPRGVYPASRITPAAVRSYRTFSPLPGNGRYVFCGTFRKIRLSGSPRPLAGTLPCGDRTFLPRRGDCPSGRLQWVL